MWGVWENSSLTSRLFHNYPRQKFLYFPGVWCWKHVLESIPIFPGICSKPGGKKNEVRELEEHKARLPSRFLHVQQYVVYNVLESWHLQIKGGENSLGISLLHYWMGVKPRAAESPDVVTDLQRQVQRTLHILAASHMEQTRKADPMPRWNSPAIQLSFSFDHPMHDQRICKSPLNSGPLEHTRSDWEDVCYLEEHFLMIRLKKQNTPAGRRVQANPCCATALQRQLILLQFQTASQSFNILIHSMQ